MSANQPISESVAIRWPDDTTHVLKINADGSINIGTSSAGYSSTNITTATTTTVKTGAGVLHSITVNSKGTIASSVVAYDNTAGSGTKLATVDSLDLSGTFTYDAAFSTGLTIVTTGTVAPDITVAWR